MAHVGIIRTSALEQFCGCVCLHRCGASLSIKQQQQKIGWRHQALDSSPLHLTIAKQGANLQTQCDSTRGARVPGSELSDCCA